MKNVFLGFSLLAFIIFCTHCKSDDEVSPNYDTSETGEYFPLAVGNYWIYEEEVINLTTSVGVLSGLEDTVRVIEQKKLAGIDFFVLEKSTRWDNIISKSIFYLRDSSGYLVNQKGEVQFSAIALDQVLRTYTSPTFDLYIEFSVKDSIINEINDLGFFPCLDFQGVYYIDGELTLNEHHNYYSKGVGLVATSSILAINPTRDKRKRLKEYYIQ